MDIPVPNPSTNLEINLVLDISQLKFIFITTDKALTLKTNDSGSPQETIALAADKTLIWYAGCPWDIPFAGDVTAGFITNASGGAATLQVRGSADVTP